MSALPRLRFTMQELVEAVQTQPVRRWLDADRRAQRAVGERARRMRRHIADRAWAVLTDVQREAARRAWREVS